jgi:hypothetical protein
MFSTFGFSIQEFSYDIFIVKKRPLYVNFSNAFAENDFFLNVPHLL